MGLNELKKNGRVIGEALFHDLAMIETIRALSIRYTSMR